MTFVYCGHPSVGIAAVYLGAAIKSEGAHQWAWVRRIYSANGILAEPAVPSELVYPSFSKQVEPELVIDLKAKDKADSLGAVDQ